MKLPTYQPGATPSFGRTPYGVASAGYTALAKGAEAAGRAFEVWNTAEQEANDAKAMSGYRREMNEYEADAKGKTQYSPEELTGLTWDKAEQNDDGSVPSHLVQKELYRRKEREARERHGGGVTDPTFRKKWNKKVDQYAIQGEHRTNLDAIDKRHARIVGKTETAIQENVNGANRDNMPDAIRENNEAIDNAVKSGAMDYNVGETAKLKQRAAIHYGVAEREINGVLAQVQDEAVTPAEARAQLEAINKLATSEASGMSAPQKENIEDQVRAAKKAVKVAEARVDTKAIRAKAQEFVAGVQDKTTEEQLKAARAIGGDDPTDQQRLVRDDAVSRILARSNQEETLKAREMKKLSDDTWATVRKTMSIDHIDPRLPQATQDAMKKFAAQGGAPVASNQNTMRQLQIFYYKSPDSFASYDLSQHFPDLTQTHFDYWSGKQKELKKAATKAPSLTSVRTAKGVADDYLKRTGLENNDGATAGAYRVAQSALDDFEAAAERKARPDERAQIINRALAKVGKDPRWWEVWEDAPTTIGTITKRITDDAVVLDKATGETVTLDFVIRALRGAKMEINVANMDAMYGEIVKQLQAGKK